MAEKEKSEEEEPYVYVPVPPMAYKEVYREPSIFSTVSTILNTIHDKLDEVECAGEKMVAIDGQQALSFEWEGYGLKMEIPAHAAGQSGSPPLQIGMVALISGPFEFPPGTQLVSGVYAIASSRKPWQPLLLLMEHCVDLEEGRPLHFVRASCSQLTRPYQFEYLDKGNFPINAKYGSIQLERFSLVAIVLGRIGRRLRRTYQSSVFYKAHVYKEPEAPRRWVTIFGVTKGLQLHEQHINKWYENATFSDSFEFKFANEEIQLGLKKKQPENKWIISPRNHPCTVAQEAVDELGGTSYAPTARRITVEAGPDATMNLKYNVPIMGTHKDDHSFLIECYLTDSTIIASVGTSGTSGHSSTVISTSGTSPGQPILTDTTTQAMAASSMSEASGHGTAMATSGISPDHPTSTKILTIDDIHDVCEALVSFNLAWWKVLGRKLGLREDLLDEIKADYQQHGVRECLNEILAHWLRRNYCEAKFGRPTWQNLATAVKKSGNPALAAKIRAEH